MKRLFQSSGDSDKNDNELQDGNTHEAIMERCINGEIRDSKIISSPLKDKTGNVIGVVQVIEDVTDKKRWEEKLKISEEKYRTLMYKANDIIFVHELVNGVPGTFTEGNEVACEKLGYSKEELLSMTPMDLVPKSLLNKNRVPSITQTLIKEKKITFETIFLTKSGKEIPFEVNSHLISLQGKTVVLALMRDITERKQVEAKITSELFTAYQELELKNKELVTREKDLVTANNRIYNILESITDSFFALDTDWRFTYVNSVAKKDFKKNKEEILGKKLYDVFSEADLLAFEKEYKRSIENKGETQFEAYFEPTSQWFEVRAYPSQDGMSVFYKDVTKRKRDEELLIKSRDFYLSLFEEFPALIWRSGLDAKCNYFNTTWLQFTGRTLEQELGDGWAEGVHPEDLDRCIKTYLDAFKARESFIMRYRLRSYDGEYRWIVDRGRPFYDLNNNFAGYIGSCYDITEQKIIAEELKKSEERYRSLIEQSSEGIFVLNPVTRKIQEVNQQMINLLGYSEKEFKELYYDDLVVAELNSINMNIDRVLKGETIFLTRQYKKKDGTIIHVDVVSSLISYGQSKVCLVNVRDVTERKQAEDKLNKSYQNLKLTLTETVNALVTVSEKRDPYTAGHQHRVAELACAIAKEMNLTDKQLEGILTAGKLHDIGKIYVPSDILNKPGRLTEIEMAIIKTHSQVGHDILSKIPFESPVAEIVAQHHERIDGSGYPKGLVEKEILLEAKILAVADVVEAMASHRPYRPALGMQKALEELERNKGKFYDALVVNTCLNIINSKRFAFEESIRGEIYAE